MNMKKLITPILSILSFILFSCQANSQTLVTRVVAQNFEHPWEIIWGPDNQLWMTERIGKITRVDPVTGTKTPLLTIAQVVTGGERGLLGMALHPNFTTIPQLFVAFTYLDGNDDKVKVVRYDYANNALTNPFTIIENIEGNTTHDGCRLFIDANLKLFITTGDAQNLSAPQNLANLNGKVLRLNLDGSIPSDNPNPNSKVWSSGHRNSQGFVIANGKIYASEHGPDQDDEINIITAGGNYGWPNIKGACNEASETVFCADSNVIVPIAAWTPTIATAGLDYYNNVAIPEWSNSLLLTTLKDESLRILTLNQAGTAVTNQATKFKSQFGRIRDLCISPAGKVYIVTTNGKSFQGGIGDRIIEISNSTSGIAKTKTSFFSVFPNPIANSKEAILNFAKTGNYFLNLTDINGKSILKQTIAASADIPFSLSLPQISKGIYFLGINGTEGSENVKLIID